MELDWELKDEQKSVIRGDGEERHRPGKSFDMLIYQEQPHMPKRGYRPNDRNLNTFLRVWSYFRNNTEY